MTENKRFIIKPDGINQYTVSDKLNQFGLPITNEMHCKVIAYALNELHEENKKLKQVNEMLQMDFAMTERNLIEENEQLKQDNFICLDCKYSGYTEIGCLCEKKDHWTDYKTECEDYEELQE